MALAGAESALQRKAVRYDRAGDQHYDLISSWIKATRASDVDASLYYLAIMLEGGEDPRFIVRRMVILASEDIGNADPRALMVATSTAAAIELVGLPEGAHALAQCAVYLALAPKSNASYKALGAARAHVREHGAQPPPAYLRSGPLADEGYDYAHDHPGHVSPQQVMPPGLEGLRFYEPDGRGALRRTGRGDPAGARAGRMTLSSVAPATGEALGTVAIATEHNVLAAVAEARAVQGPGHSCASAIVRATWRGPPRRSSMRPTVGALICREQAARARRGRDRRAVARDRDAAVAGRGRPGDPLGRARRLSRALRPLTRARWSYEPLGVVAVLGPAAEPFATPLGDVAVALMAGNGVVLKPSPHAALSGARIARVFARAGLPPGLLQVVQGHAATGGALVEAPVAQVRFTGSALAGAKVLEEGRAASSASSQSSAGQMPRSSAPTPTSPARSRASPGARLPTRASPAARSSASTSCARSPTSCWRGWSRGRALRVGDPADAETEIGPLVGGERLGRVVELLDDAVAQGATLHCGGPVAVAGFSGAFCAPAVLTGVPAGARLAREEAPGPVVAVTIVDGEEDAIAAANDSALGLGASVWTSDRYKGERIARELRVGMVWMNDHHVARSAPQLPWGGVRGSGIGRARGAIALRTCAEPKVITLGPAARQRRSGGFYDRALARTVRAVAHLRSTRDADRERGLRDGAAPALTVAARTLRSLRRK